MILTALVLICGLFVGTGTSLQEKKGDDPRKVKDEANLFSKDAIEKADAIIAKIKEKHRKDLWVETVEKGPTKGVAKWAEERFEAAGLDGVYIVITNEPKRFEVVVGKKAHALITVANRDAIKSILAKNLKDNHDDALVKAAEYTLKALDENARALAPRLVRDDAKLFSEDAVKQANEIVAKIKEKHHKDLFIETLEEGKDAKESAAWARERAEKAGVDGIYVVITTKPKRFEIVVGEKTLAKGIFTIADRDELRRTLIANLGKKSDEALLEVARETMAALDRRAVPAGKKEPPPPRD